MVRSPSFRVVGRADGGRRRRCQRWAGALAVVVGAFVGTALLPLSPASASSGAGQFVTDANSARSSNGAQALATNSDLTSVAQGWAQHMADTGDLSHNPNLADIKSWDKLGENVGYGPDVAAIQDAFMHSAGHRANILDKDFTQIGVGVVVKNGVVWVSEVFRQPDGTEAAPTHQAAKKHRSAPQPARSVVVVSRTTPEHTSAKTPSKHAKHAVKQATASTPIPLHLVVPKGSRLPSLAARPTPTLIAQGPGGPRAIGPTQDTASKHGNSSLPAAGTLGLLAVLGLAVSLRARRTP